MESIEFLSENNAEYEANVNNYNENTKYNYITLYLNNVINISAVSLEIHFNASLIDVDMVYTYTDSVFDSKIDNQNGVVTVTSLFNEPLNGSIDFLRISFNTKSVNQLTYTSFQVLTTSALDKDFNSINLPGKTFSFYIQDVEDESSKKANFLMTASKNTLEQGENLEITITSNELKQLNAGKFLVSYDKDLLEYNGYTKGIFLDNNSTIFNINDKNPGSIDFSFINTTNIDSIDLITLRFTSKLNIESSCYISLTPSSLIDNELNQYSSSTTQIKINFSYNQIYEQEDSLYATLNLNENEFNVSLSVYIKDNTNFSVGDFNIGFDSNKLKYLGYSQTNILDNFYISYVDETKVNNGSLDFHLLMQDENYDKGLIYTFNFEFINKCDNFSTSINFSGKNLAELDLKPLKNISQQYDFATNDLAHTPGEWTVTKEATCTENGLKELRCTVCGELLDSQEIPATGHKASWKVATPATCSEEGVESYVCEICGEVLDTRPIEKIPHTPGEWAITKEPTCTENGSKELTCSVCGEVLETETIPATGHQFGEWTVTKEATCTEKGIETRTCSICGEKETREIPAKGHLEGEWTIVKEATCTENGLKELRCTVCGELLDSQEIPATGHKASWKVTTPATCSEEGVESYVCEICGEVLDTRPIEKIPHTPGEWTITKEPTCTENGSKELTCSVCGEVLETETIPATGHQFGEWTVTKEATCTEKGIETRTCSICGEKETREIPAKGHVATWVVTTPATQDSEGTESYICSVCGQTLDTRIIPKLDNSKSNQDNNNLALIIVLSIISLLVLIGIVSIVIAIKKKKR